MDEYIDTYTANEMAKLEDRRRRKSVGKKGLMGKVLEKISKIQLVGEKVKGPDVTAQKAAKIITDMTGKNRSLTMKRSNSRAGELSTSPGKRMSRLQTGVDKY